MDSIGKLIAGAGAFAQATAVERRRYRVTLCVHVFATVEIDAVSAHEAQSIAERNPPSKPVRKFRTEPVAGRVEVFQPWDREWAEVRS